MSESTPAASQQLIGIQYLRAIAALMVAYYHGLAQIPAYEPLLHRYLLGDFNLPNGVDLFFVISGFIMVLTSSRVSPGDFAIRRIIRIVPLYWVLTFAIALLGVTRPGLLHSTMISTEYVIKSLLFIPYPNPAQDNQLLPLLAPGWSLNLEMFFYLVFTFVLFLRPSRRLFVAALVFIAVVETQPLTQHVPHTLEISFYQDCRLFEFLFGMIVAQLYVKGFLRIGITTAWFMVVIGFAVLFAGIPFLHLTPGSPEQILIENGLASVCIIIGMLTLEPQLRRRPLPFLALLGDASYSMYLSHVFFLGAARFFWIRLRLDIETPPYAIGFAVISMALCVVGALLVYRLIELPSLHILQKLYRRRRQTTPSAESIARASESTPKPV